LLLQVACTFFVLLLKGFRYLFRMFDVLATVTYFKVFFLVLGLVILVSLQIILSSLV
jgi:hypothetical protein